MPSGLKDCTDTDAFYDPNKSLMYYSTGSPEISHKDFKWS